ncbi:MAG: hypothetical protein IPP55_18155 [Anaerolineales bacterium]|nr:hypothetical protein [Anaerolineales bacterium]
MDPAVTPIGNLTEDIFAKFVEHLSVYSTATEQLYLQAVKGFLFVDSENYAKARQASVTPGGAYPSNLSILRPARLS